MHPIQCVNSHTDQIVKKNPGLANIWEQIENKERSRVLVAQGLVGRDVATVYASVGKRYLHPSLAVALGGTRGASTPVVAIRTTSRTTRGTVAAAGRTSHGQTNWRKMGVLLEVQLDMGHGDRVEGDGSAVAAAEDVQVPGLDLLLLSLRQTGELEGRGVLLSVVHSSLVVVARATAVERAEVVAILSTG